MTGPDDRDRLPSWLRAFPGAVLRLSPDGTVLDSDGRLDAELGRPLVGAAFADALDADSSLAKWERALAAAPARAADPGARACELVLRGTDTPGETRAFSVLWDAGGPAVYLVEHPRDPRLDHLRDQVSEVVTDLAGTQRELLKRNALLAATTAELERSNRALDEFAHVVSHDLRAPLRSIANAARWTVEDHGADLPAEAARNLERIERQVERMRALVAGILAYAQAGREHAPTELVDVDALLGEILALVDPPPSVVVTVDPGMPTLRSPRAPLQQVLQNLLGNAIAHGGGAVRVSARDAGAFHELAVADDGPGIPSHLHERIWTLFHTQGRGGPAERSGIGLAVVRRLVEAQGGRAWVESREGQGATFRFLWRTQPEGRDRG